ncbi:MAG TPA: cyclic nucleotide-binding domain-containing protein [Anaerolineae bacterium]|nr:cyclic nucleotide-binding domain-containing protein [Anaerolineae bacterium]
MSTIGLFRNTEDALTFEAGQTIFEEGQPGDSMYAIVEGEVDILLGEKVIDTGSAGGIIGEMALIDSSPRSATARAKTACKLAPIDQRRFTFLVQQTPFFAIEVMRIMADRLRRLMANAQ